MTKSEFEPVRSEFLSFDSCLVSDALESLGLPNGVRGVSRQTTRRRIFGRAITVRLEAFRGDTPKRHLGTAAIDSASPGDVIVVEHHARSDCAGWGGLLSTAALAKGVSGVVVDGLARDIDESEDLGFPVFARGATPITARNKVMETSTNQMISLGGVPVNPGDLVLADGSGIVVIPKLRLNDVLVVARRMLELENGIRKSLQSLMPISKAMDESYEKAIHSN
jgi:4-hydroxy-4-methyl-2-oxoglutarate aldolase